MPSIFCSDLTFTWPDGERVLDGVDLRLGPGRTGLIGVNGSGKSTLLRLIAGQLRPSRGVVHADGTVAYLPQHLTLDVDRRIDDVLGIASVRAALQRAEAGDATAHDLDVVGDDWDIDDRARATLDRLGLHAVDLDRTVGSVSGGETVLLALAAHFLARPAVLLLDEPTNNLDSDRRRRLYEAVDAYGGVVLVVSHDRALLERMDRIAELRDHAIRVHAGNLTAYEDALAREQDAAQRGVQAAEADLRRQRRELVDAHVVIDRRQRTGRKQAAERRYPKVVAQQRKRQAQVSAAKLRGVHTDRLARAEAAVDEARATLRDDDVIRVTLPGTAVPSRRIVAECAGVTVALGRGDGAGSPLWRSALDLTIRGPERIALTGPNGAGKTTVLRLLTGLLEPTTGTIARHVPTRLLPQRLDLLDDGLGLVANVRRVAPRATENEIRAGLARLELRGHAVDRPAGTLSGGERFRAVLAVLLTAPPPPQLLLLDEPTNNLDLASVDQLVEALRGYRGALVVASHDAALLDAIGVTRRLQLDRDGLHGDRMHW